MKCPRCETVPLDEKRVKGSKVLVDQCVACGGIWFDVGELSSVLTSAIAGLQASAEDLHCLRECPRCKLLLQSLDYPGTSIEVDVCSKCGGIWLDKREFGAIRIRREKMTPEQRSEEPVEDDAAPEIDRLPDLGTAIDRDMNRDFSQPAAERKFIPRIDKRDLHPNSTGIISIGGLLIRLVDAHANSTGHGFSVCPSCQGHSDSCSTCEGRGEVCGSCGRARCWCDTVGYEDPDDDAGDDRVAD